LMTMSGTTGSDPKLSRDALNDDKKVVARSVPAESAADAIADPVTVQIPAGVAAPDLAFDIPEPDSPTPIAGPIPLPPIAKPVVQRSVQEVCDALTDAAQSNDLPVPFFIHLLFQESRFNAAEVSAAGAQGIAQFMPETAVDMGLKNPFDPVQAIPASARLLRNLVAQFGNLGLAAAAYNAGPKRIQDWLGTKTDKKGDKKTKLPEETQGFVRIITGHPVESWTDASAAHPGQRLPQHAPCQEAAGLYAWAGPETIPLPTSSPLTQRAQATHQGRPVEHRMMAALKIAKPAKSSETSGVKIGSQQLAARQHKADQHKLEKVAER